MFQIINAAFARQFLQRLHGAANVHDAQAVAALCCEDVEWEDPAAPQTLLYLNFIATSCSRPCLIRVSS
jgi:hypothetical protein